MTVEINAGWFELYAPEISSMLGNLGEQIVADAKSAAPVKTGELRSSISSEVSDGELIVSADSDHAIYVEMGTEHQPAQSFMRNALYRERDIS